MSLDYLNAYQEVARLPLGEWAGKWMYVMVARLECRNCDHERFHVWPPFDLLSGQPVPPPIQMCPNCKLWSVWFDTEIQPIVVRRSEHADAAIDAYIAQYTRTASPSKVSPSSTT